MKPIDKDYVADMLGELLLKYPTLSKNDRVIFGIAFQEAVWLFYNNQVA